MQKLEPQDNLWIKKAAILSLSWLLIATILSTLDSASFARNYGLILGLFGSPIAYILLIKDRVKRWYIWLWGAFVPPIIVFIYEFTLLMPRTADTASGIWLACGALAGPCFLPVSK